MRQKANLWQSEIRFFSLIIDVVCSPTTERIISNLYRCTAQANNRRVESAQARGRSSLSDQTHFATQKNGHSARDPYYQRYGRLSADAIKFCSVELNVRKLLRTCACRTHSTRRRQSIVRIPCYVHVACYSETSDLDVVTRNIIGDVRDGGPGPGNVSRPRRTSAQRPDTYILCDRKHFAENRKVVRGIFSENPHRQVFNVLSVENNTTNDEHTSRIHLLVVEFRLNYTFSFQYFCSILLKITLQ